ncbi:MAG: class I SAM-dependent methyltransferase [Acidobacteriota bacterium]|nr:MAG: class I SAM-dependent methyltransferase [Acidobacteriota bacterium]
MNEERLHAFLGKMVGDLGAAVSTSLVIMGDKLGLYKTLAAEGPLTSQGLADRTSTTERYVREWLAAQSASGYVDYDADSNTFSMNPEQIAVFADDDSPVNMTGGFYAIASVVADEPKVTAAFRSGEGISWGDHNTCLFCGTEKFFKPSYKANLVSAWIPALTGVEEKLKRGAKVADIGCGHGASTMVMAEAYPESEFHGYDFHHPSIVHARTLAQGNGCKNVAFETVTARNAPGSGYDLVAFFDCLHDMGDPVGALSHAREMLNPDGSCLIVEPFAQDAMIDNMNPVGRVYYSFSTVICTPSALSQEGGMSLGAQAGEARLREVAAKAGFSEFRRATETPFNLIFEARK